MAKAKWYEWWRWRLSVSLLFPTASCIDWQCTHTDWQSTITVYIPYPDARISRFSSSRLHHHLMLIMITTLWSSVLHPHHVNHQHRTERGRVQKETFSSFFLSSIWSLAVSLLHHESWSSFLFVSLFSSFLASSSSHAISITGSSLKNRSQTTLSSLFTRIISFSSFAHYFHLFFLCLELSKKMKKKKKKKNINDFFAFNELIILIAFCF